MGIVNQHVHSSMLYCVTPPYIIASYVPFACIHVRTFPQFSRAKGHPDLVFPSYCFLTHLSKGITLFHTEAKQRYSCCMLLKHKTM